MKRSTAEYTLIFTVIGIAAIGAAYWLLTSPIIVM